MRFILLLLVFAFPIAELWTLINLAQAYGWWLLLYLIMIGYLGLQLIRQEKQLFSARMLHTLTQGGHPIKAMFGSARIMIAGVLLMIPGVITDAIAAILLLIPRAKIPPTMFGDAKANNEAFHFNADLRDVPHQTTRNAANDDVIEGEFKREDD